MIVFPPCGYTVAWYGRIVGSFGNPIWNSLRIALAAVALSLLIGVPAGIGLSRYRFRGRGTISIFLLSPLTIPGIAIGLAIYVLAVWIEEQTTIALAAAFPKDGCILYVSGMVVPRTRRTRTPRSNTSTRCWSRRRNWASPRIWDICRR